MLVIEQTIVSVCRRGRHGRHTYTTTFWKYSNPHNYNLWSNKYLNIRHAYPITVLLDKDYVKRVNDSPGSAIHNTFSQFAAFFIVAVTKRFNVDRVYCHEYVLLYHPRIGDVKRKMLMITLHITRISYIYIYSLVLKCSTIS